MSIGNTKDQGNKGNNFPYQLRNLQLLASIATTSAGLATEATQLQVLGALQTQQEFFQNLVIDTGGVGCPGNCPVYTRVMIYDEGTGTWSTTYYDAAGNIVVPVGPVVFLNPQYVLEDILVTTTTLADTVSIDDASVLAVTTKGINIMAVATPGDGSVDANDIGMVAMSLDRRLHVDANMQISNADVDATHPLPISKDASANATGNRIWTTGNIDQLGGNAINLGNGAVSTGTLRITIGTDDTQFGQVGAASDVDGNIHGQLRYIGEALASGTAVKGTVADDAVATADAPVKVGGVADSAASLVADGDMVHFITDLYRQLRIAGYDEILDILKTTEQAPLWAHRTTVTFTQAAANGTTYFMIIPMDTYKSGSIQLDVYSNNAADVATIKAYSTNDTAVNLIVTTATILSDKWVDSSVDILGAASVVTPGGAATNSRYQYFLDTNIVAEYICISFLAAVTTTLTLNAYAKITY